MTKTLATLALATAIAVVQAVTVGAAERPGVGAELAVPSNSSATFPSRELILTLPSTATLSTKNLTVLENGERVNDLSVELPGTGGARTGVVLLIDASRSMEGKPIEAAIDAARVFATRLPSRIEVALIPFNNKTPVVLPLTKNPQRIANVLADTPALAFGTRIDDAVAAASNLLSESGVTVGSIVLLSDGADVGSSVEPETALAAAQQAGVRVFSIGLSSPQFDATLLSMYAKRTGGAYVAAKSADDLAPIYRQLGARISSQYVLRYQSFADAGERVYVSVRAAGFPGLATTAYSAPGLPTFAVQGDSWWDRVIQSAWLAVLVGCAVVGLIGYAVYLLVRLIDRRFEKRMSAFVAMSDEEQLRQRQEEVRSRHPEEQEGEPTGVPGTRWYAQLERDIVTGRIGRSAGQLVALTVLAAAVVAALMVVATGLWWSALIGIIPFFVMRAYVDWKVRTLHREFGEQLPETLDVVSSALRAGHSLVGALGVAVEGAPEPSRSELGRALADERLGVPLDEALRGTAHRMANTDLTQVSLVAMLQREAGTNSADVLDQVATNVRHQIELRRLIRTLTAQGRMSRWIVTLLPVGLFLALFLINENYLSPLWETPGGVLALIVAASMIVLGSYFIKRIVEIDV